MSIILNNEFWKLEGWYPTNGTDRSVNGNDGTVNGTPASTTGKTHPTTNGCYTYDGVDDYINVPNITGIDFTATDSFTVMFWIKMNAIATKERICGTGSTTGANYIFMDSGNAIGGKIRALCEGGNGEILSMETGSQYDNNVFHHVALVFDASASPQEGVIYVDAISDATGTASGAMTGNMANGTDWGIGKWTPDAAIDFVGDLDDFRIFARKMTLAEIKMMRYRRVRKAHIGGFI